jgi:hypothetical protein
MVEKRGPQGCGLLLYPAVRQQKKPIIRAAKKNNVYIYAIKH